MKSIKYLIILLLSLFALESNAQGYKIILKDGRTATVRADETELITFSKSVTTKTGSVPGYKIILSSGKNIIIGTEETEIFTFTTDVNLKTNISAFEEIAVSSITLSASSLSMNGGEVVTLTADIQPNNASDKTVTWTSDNPNVATVDNDGLVTAKAPGTATITVSAADGSEVSASCSVTVSQLVNIYYGTLDHIPTSLSEMNKQTIDSVPTSIKVYGGNKCVYMAIPNDSLKITYIKNSNDGDLPTLEFYGENSKTLGYKYINNYIVYYSYTYTPLAPSQYFTYTINTK